MLRNNNISCGNKSAALYSQWIRMISVRDIGWVESWILKPCRYWKSTISIVLK